MDNGKMQNRPNEFPPIKALLVILLALLCLMYIGPVLALYAARIPVLKEGKLACISEYILIHIPYLLLFSALATGSFLILNTPLSRLIAGKWGRISCRRAAYSYILYTAILALFSALSYKTVSIDPAPLKEKALFIIPVLLLTPVQVLAEELLFRVIPARAVYHEELPEKTVDAMPLSIISGIIFMIPHICNPEVMKSQNGIIAVIYYFLWGSSAMALALYSGSFEIPAAMHTANNIYCALAVNYRDSVMPTKAFFLDDSSPSSWMLLFRAITIYAVFFAFAWRLKKRNIGRTADGRKEEDE